MYKSIPIDEIPWNNEQPPRILVDLVECGKIKPCRCIDLGCGAGNYAIYLSQKGFTVTGIDISPTAISIARENAKKKGAVCDFMVADVLHAEDQILKTFDFAYDWEVLHHVFPKFRKRYVENVHRLLNPGGKYLSVCFSEKDPQFGGKGKYRHTRIGTILYFSSENELKKLFSRYFHVSELKTIEISAKSVSHIANYVLVEKPLF
ncbi:MAG TPA: class I SAM-dependent methyltransferase [Desulfomonilia bacterium]|nr:class I SAM-dependent methyltransferase [Desulfomonilia bacterium]